MVNAMTTMEPILTPKTTSSASAHKPTVVTAPTVATAKPVGLPAPAGQPIIEIDQVDFCYGEHKALHGISLKIAEKEVTDFIGPSGCGKSTLLRCLNRMNDLIDGTTIHGTIRINGQDIYAPGTDVIDVRRRV